jgi:hypothetical protein
MRTVTPLRVEPRNGTLNEPPKGEITMETPAPMPRRSAAAEAAAMKFGTADAPDAASIIAKLTDDAPRVPYRSSIADGAAIKLEELDD